MQQFCQKFGVASKEVWELEGVDQFKIDVDSRHPAKSRSFLERTASPAASKLGCFTFTILGLADTKLDKTDTFHTQA